MIVFCFVFLIKEIKFDVALIVVIVLPMSTNQDTEPQMAPTLQCTLLCHACRTTDIELCQILLDAKVNVNTQGEVQ